MVERTGVSLPPNVQGDTQGWIRFKAASFKWTSRPLTNFPSFSVSWWGQSCTSFSSSSLLFPVTIHYASHLPLPKQLLPQSDHENLHSIVYPIKSSLDTFTKYLSDMDGVTIQLLEHLTARCIGWAKCSLPFHSGCLQKLIPIFPTSSSPSNPIGHLQLEIEISMSSHSVIHQTPSPELIPRIPPQPSSDKPLSYSQTDPLAFSSPKKKPHESLSNQFILDALSSVSTQTSKSSSFEDNYCIVSFPEEKKDYLKKEMRYFPEQESSDSLWSPCTTEEDLEDDILIEALNTKMGKSYFATRKNSDNHLDTTNGSQGNTEISVPQNNTPVKDNIKKTVPKDKPKVLKKVQPALKKTTPSDLPPIPKPSNLKPLSNTISCFFYLFIHSGSDFAIDTLDIREYTQGIYISSRLFSPRSSPVETSPIWLDMCTADKNNIPLNFSHTIPLTFSPEFVEMYSKVPLIVEIRQKVKQNNIISSSKLSIPQDSLVGLLKLPFYHLISTLTNNSSNNCDILSQPLIIPETSYAVISPLTGNHVGRVNCFMALGMMQHIQIMQKQMSKQYEVIQPSHNVELVDLGKKITLDAIEKNSTESIEEQSHVVQKVSQKDPSPESILSNNKEIQTIQEPSTKRCHIKVIIHRACGLKYLVWSKLRNDDDLPTYQYSHLEYANTVGPNTFVTLNLFPSIRSDSVSLKSSERKSNITTNIIPESFTPEYEYSSEWGVEDFNSDMIHWIYGKTNNRGFKSNDGVAVGHIWHYYSSPQFERTNPDNYQHDRVTQQFSHKNHILLGTFRVNLSFLLKRRSGICRVWVPLMPHPVDHNNNGIGAVIQVSLFLENVHDPFSIFPYQQEFADASDLIDATSNNIICSTGQKRARKWYIDFAICIKQVHLAFSNIINHKSSSFPDELGVYFKFQDPESKETYLQTQRFPPVVSEEDLIWKDLADRSQHELFEPLANVFEFHCNHSCKSKVDLYGEMYRTLRDNIYEIKVYSSQSNSKFQRSSATAVRYHGSIFIDLYEPMTKIRRSYRHGYFRQSQSNFKMEDCQVVEDWYPIIDPDKNSLLGADALVKVEMRLASQKNSRDSIKSTDTNGQNKSIAVQVDSGTHYKDIFPTPPYHLPLPTISQTEPQKPDIALLKNNLKSALSDLENLQYQMKSKLVSPFATNNQKENNSTVNQVMTGLSPNSLKYDRGISLKDDGLYKLTNYNLNGDIVTARKDTEALISKESMKAHLSRSDSTLIEVQTDDGEIEMANEIGNLNNETPFSIVQDSLPHYKKNGFDLEMSNPIHDIKRNKLGPVERDSDNNEKLEKPNVQEVPESPYTMEKKNPRDEVEFKAIIPDYLVNFSSNTKENLFIENILNLSDSEEYIDDNFDSLPHIGEDSVHILAEACVDKDPIDTKDITQVGTDLNAEIKCDTEATSVGDSISDLSVFRGEDVEIISESGNRAFSENACTSSNKSERITEDTEVEITESSLSECQEGVDRKDTEDSEETFSSSLQEFPNFFPKDYLWNNTSLLHRVSSSQLPSLPVFESPYAIKKLESSLSSSPAQQHSKQLKWVRDMEVKLAHVFHGT